MNQQLPVYVGIQNRQREAAHQQRQKDLTDHRNQVYRIYLELCEHGGWDTLSDRQSTVVQATINGTLS